MCYNVIMFDVDRIGESEKKTMTTTTHNEWLIYILLVRQVNFAILSIFRCLAWNFYASAGNKMAISLQ